VVAAFALLELISYELQLLH